MWLLKKTGHVTGHMAGHMTDHVHGHSPTSKMATLPASRVSCTARLLVPYMLLCTVAVSRNKPSAMSFSMASLVVKW